MTCDAELCPYWTGQGCICEVIDLPRGQDAPVHACPPDNGGAMPCCGKTPPKSSPTNYERRAHDHASHTGAAAC